MNDKLQAAIEALRIPHRVVEEDCWYTCPAYKPAMNADGTRDWAGPSGNCNDDAGDACDCGADEHNQRVDEVLELLDLLMERVSHEAQDS